MLSKIRTHLTYANVMATIAVFAAIGGTSYAAAHITSGDIANNTVQSRDIKNSSILSKDIKNNSVRSRDVRDGSLLLRDFRPGQLPAGPAGPQGPAGKDAADGIGGGGGTGSGSGGGSGGGASVVAHARNAAPFTPTSTADTPVPLKGNTWTQDAAEADTMVARVTAAGPAGSCDVSVSLFVDGNYIGGTALSAGNTGLVDLPGLPGGTSVARTLTATASVDTMACGVASTNTTSVDVAIDVIGAQ